MCDRLLVYSIMHSLKIGETLFREQCHAFNYWIQKDETQKRTFWRYWETIWMTQHTTKVAFSGSILFKKGYRNPPRGILWSTRVKMHLVGKLYTFFSSCFIINTDCTFYPKYFFDEFALSGKMGSTQEILRKVVNGKCAF